jgi:hypothetical protein
MRSKALAAGVALGFTLWAGASVPKITEAQKFAIIRDLIAEVGIARQPLPPDKHGVRLDSTGRVLNPDAIAAARYDSGRAAKVGDRVAITAIQFHSNHIVFMIDGGPHNNHWYNHLTVGMGGTQPVAQSVNQVGNHGAVITLGFPSDVPALTPEQVKHDLAALIDFDPPSEAEEMVQALPPSVKAAIKAHRALVGMNEDMVIAALGRTGNKSGETDAQGQPYEDWIYGAPPQPTTFVRLVGGHVTRVTTYYANGTQVVDNKPDPALVAWNQHQSQQAAVQAQQDNAPAPTLRRPGDAAPTGASNGTQAMPPPPTAPGSYPTDPNGFPTTPPGQGMPPTTTGPPTVCCGVSFASLRALREPF